MVAVLLLLVPLKRWQAYEEIVDKLLPELRKRGLARRDYPDGDGTSEILTFREQLFGQKTVDITHPAHDLNWTAEESRKEFENRLRNIESLEK